MEEYKIRRIIKSEREKERNFKFFFDGIRFILVSEDEGAMLPVLRSRFPLANPQRGRRGPIKGPTTTKRIYTANRHQHPPLHPESQCQPPRARSLSPPPPYARCPEAFAGEERPPGIPTHSLPCMLCETELPNSDLKLFGYLMATSAKITF
jgi:hypothetical protein